MVDSLHATTIIVTSEQMKKQKGGINREMDWIDYFGKGRDNNFIMSAEVKEPIKPVSKPSKPNNNQRVSVLDYASVRNLSKGQAVLHDLLPGISSRPRASFLRRSQPQEPQMIEQPKLLTTAKSKLQEAQEQAKSQTSNSNFLGISSFLNSREVTPNNPLTAHRRKPFQKNKMNSMGSELFDIQSNPEEQDKGPARFKNKDFRLYDIITGQSQVVYRHVFSRDRQINPKTILAWKDCLSHEDKTEIYLPVEGSKVEIPYTSSRIYQLNEIEKGFKEIYGTGKNRSLSIGKQSVLLQAIQRYLRICSKDPLKIGRKDYDIIQQILRDSKMQELEDYPMCMKQLQTHFKLMATKWRYSGNLDLNDRIIQSALIMGKNNFLDLNRQNALTTFLLRHSNINDI